MISVDYIMGSVCVLSGLLSLIIIIDNTLIPNSNLEFIDFKSYFSNLQTTRLLLGNISAPTLCEVSKNPQGRSDEPGGVEAGLWRCRGGCGCCGCGGIVQKCDRTDTITGLTTATASTPHQHPHHPSRPDCLRC